MKTGFNFIIIKKLKALLLATLLLTLCVSCRTAMDFTKQEIVLSGNCKKANMDFIGFKYTSKNNKLIRYFGEELNKRQIAINSQETYPGNIDLYGLSNYASKCRYSTFVEIKELNYYINDNIDHNESLELGGWLVAGLSAFTLFPVYIPMLVKSNPNRTQVQLKFDALICVYDSTEKKIIYTYPVKKEITEKFIGTYHHKENDKNRVDIYYRNIIWNELLNGFMSINEYIEKLK